MRRANAVSRFFATAASIRGAGCSRPFWWSTNSVTRPFVSVLKLICAGTTAMKNFDSLSGNTSTATCPVKRARKCPPSRVTVQMMVGDS